MADINKDTLVSLLTDIADGFRTSRSLTNTLTLGEMAELAAVPVGGGGGDNKLPQLVDGTLTEITAEDLDGATNIRRNCFSYARITSIVIPESVETINDRAFEYCSSLISVIIGNGVTKIGASTFYDCTTLRDVTIGNMVTTIGSYAFRGCGNITSLTIPATVTSIGEYALRTGFSVKKTTFTFLGTTPPTITTTTLDATKINKIIVPAGCGEAYKAATNWANFADFIEEATV